MAIAASDNDNAIAILLYRHVIPYHFFVHLYTY